MASKGEIIIPGNGFFFGDVSVQRKQILNDLKYVWELATNKVETDLIWATDPELPVNAPAPEAILDPVPLSQKLLYPGNITFPSKFPVPAFGVQVNTYGGRDVAPMVVLSQPTEISKSPVQDYNIQDMRTREGVFPMSYTNLDGLLQELLVEKAFVVEAGVFLPMPGEGSVYETQFVPAVYPPTYDFRVVTVVDKTHIGHGWAVRKGSYQALEDLSDPDGPRLFKAEHRTLSGQLATYNDTSNQLLIIAQPGGIVEEAPVYDVVLSADGYSRAFGGVVDRPKVVQGDRTDTKTTLVDFHPSEYPTIIFRTHIYGVTRADVPSINPQSFSDFVKPLYDSFNQK